MAGAGMAGLSAAAHARALGAAPIVHEKGARPGGSMLLSSCVIWRFREWDAFRAECPTGDERLQRVVWERLDDGIAWLESLGAPVVEHETGNPRTIGKRFDPRGLTETLVRAAGDVRVGETTEEPTILATGGFQGDWELVREHIHPGGKLRLRANPWSSGDGLRHALARGAVLSAGLDEFYGRNMPDDDFSEEQFVPLAQLYGRVARVFNDRGEEFFEDEVSWSENDLVQATAQQPGARAWYLLDEAALKDEDVARRVALASTRTDPVDLPFAAPSGARVAVRVKPGITHTIGGLRTDEQARVADGLYAAGADVGGISTGGYASGLAAALVFGRIAAESALDSL
ncbi:MAG TPA: FAD-binding protein [Gaiellaceae bacterium]|nr:FAD-binding protein [Gaiellaceae bacterium]